MQNLKYVACRCSELCILAICMQNLRVLKYVGDEKKLEWGKYWIEQGFNGKVAVCVLSMMITSPFCPAVFA